MRVEELNKVKSDFEEAFKKVDNIEDLKILKSDYIGKTGLVISLMKDLKNLSNEEKKEFGSKINLLKDEVSEKIIEKEKFFYDKVVNDKLNSEYIDITIPERKENVGTIHPMSKVMKELEEIFVNMGFVMADGFEIDDDWHCFEALNFPPYHPARQMQDTFFMPDSKDIENVILRTHTTSNDVREMEKGTPPFKLFSLGKTFRREMDATHSPMFHQLDGLHVDKNINMGHLKGCLLEFLEKFFEVKNLKMRFRPSYFPFVEPGIEIDIQCSKEKGIIKIGEGEDWVEILGAGMAHPNILKSVNIDPNEYTGYAFGAGIERLAMLKYGVSDIRMLYDGDLRFLKKYGFNFFI